MHGCHCWQRCWHKKKLDLKIDYEGYYNKEVDGQPNAGHWRPKNLRCDRFFNFRDIKPGDFGEGTISLHLRHRNAWLCAKIEPRRNDDKRSTEPELLEDERDRRRNRWDGELAQNLNFRIWADICMNDGAEIGDNVYQPDCDSLLHQGTAPLEKLYLPLVDTEIGNVFTGSTGPLKKNRKYYLGMDWKVPVAVSNEIQTDTYRADIEFLAIQAKNNKSFTCYKR